jgi:lipopolysaccharide export system protein LptC
MEAVLEHNAAACGSCVMIGEFDVLAAPYGATPAPAVPWSRRIAEMVSAYLPVLLMGLLALGTWWLVKSTPQPDTQRVPAPPRHEPDYTMQRFSVQRFASDGKLRAQIEGDEVRHYPDTDTFEIDAVHMRAMSAGPHVTVATARRALVNGAATEVQLLGGAQVVREAAGGAPALEFRGEFLHAYLDSERVRSHLPVTIRRGGTEFRADTLDFDGLDRVVQLKGRVRANFTPAGSKPAFTQGVRP